MWKSVALLACVAFQLISAQHKHQYERFPADGSRKGECLDPQIDKYFREGETWATPNQRCKQSRCTSDEGTLVIDRVSCDPVKEVVDLLKKSGEGSNIFCRQAAGDRRKPFPDCCAQPLCKKRDGGKLITIPKSEYPELPDSYA